MNFYSHPNKLLKTHLKEVGEGAQECLSHLAISASDVLSRTAYLIGIAHDFGKYTSFFQNYLFNHAKSDLCQHSLISAVFGAWLVKRSIPASSNIEKFLPLIAYAVIHRHHGNLRAIDEILIDYKATHSKQIKVLIHQLEDLKKHLSVISSEMESLGVEDLFDFFSLNLPDFFKDLARLNYTIKNKLEDRQKACLTIWTQLLFSALIDSDKFSASSTKRPEAVSIPSNLVDIYVKNTFSHPTNEIDKIRMAFYKEVTQANISLDQLRQPISLTAPTGIGKTLAVFSLALKLREKIKQNRGYAPKIIYTLPFINLIEQNYKILQMIFENLDEYKQHPHRFILKSHYLAEIKYQDDEEKPLEEAILLTESWESEVVVTTFVQLFETIFGYKNKCLKKFHKLAGAILIMDELQLLPMEYWKAVKEVFQILINELRLVVIQMTATRPIIFPHTKEVLPNPQKFFDLIVKHHPRTKIKVDLNEIETQDVAREVSKLAQKDSVLVVVNTVSTSIKLYNALKENLGDFIGYETKDKTNEAASKILVYLSTNIIPWQRAERISQVNKWLKGGDKRVVMVSTQVVEAGIDFDFPILVRDIAPIDSVIQAAGRCNREGKRTIGKVFLKNIKDSQTSYVYGALHINIASEILKERAKDEISEKDYFQLVEEYFKKVFSLKSHDVSHKLLDAYINLRFCWHDITKADGKALCDFSLIPSIQEFSIFVPIKEQDENWLFNQFVKEVLEEKDINKRKNAYLRHRAALHNHLLGLRVERAKLNLPPCINQKISSIRWVPFSDRDRYYDLETGYKWLDGEASWII